MQKVYYKFKKLQDNNRPQVETQNKHKKKFFPILVLKPFKIFVQIGFLKNALQKKYKN